MAALKNILQKGQSLILITDPWQWKSHGWGIGFYFCSARAYRLWNTFDSKAGGKSRASKGTWLPNTRCHLVVTGQTVAADAGTRRKTLGRGGGQGGISPRAEPGPSRVPGPVQRGCPCHPCWALTVTHPNSPILSLAFSCIWEVLCSPFSWHAVSLDPLLLGFSDEKRDAGTC